MLKFKNKGGNSLDLKCNSYNLKFEIINSNNN